MTIFHLDVHKHNDVHEVWAEDNGKFWLMEYLFPPTKKKILEDTKILTNLIPANLYEIDRLRPIWEAFVAKRSNAS